MLSNNKKEIYENQIQPLINQIAILCKDNEMPMFFTTVIENNKKETKYQSQIIDTDFIGISLTDDKFKDLLNVMNGFRTIYPTNAETEEIIF